jgi:hypothetical protein
VPRAPEDAGAPDALRGQIDEPAADQDADQLVGPHRETLAASAFTR